jgi:hypothetical protein
VFKNGTGVVWYGVFGHSVEALRYARLAECPEIGGDEVAAPGGLGEDMLIPSYYAGKRKLV